MNNPRLKLAARFVKSVQVFANRFLTWEKQAERQHGVMLNRSQVGPELHSLVPEIGVPISGIVWLLIMNACLAFSGKYGISEQGELVLMSMFKGEADVLDEAFMSGNTDRVALLLLNDTDVAYRRAASQIKKAVATHLTQSLTGPRAKRLAEELIK
jgi:hypothetical protein